MDCIEKIDQLREQIQTFRVAGDSIGFVPTMGYLHEGHLSLVRLAKEHSDRVVVSIFVNPTQFNNPADLDTYPLDIERDKQLLAKEGVDLLYLPEKSSLYESGFQSWVSVENLTQPLEGASRPGHFRGVTTVVSMLFNIVSPDVAAFGEKDFQQLRVIEQMVADLKFGVKILRGKLIREKDGLAMSSRNVKLSVQARREALKLSQALQHGSALFQGGEQNSQKICSAVLEILGQSAQIEVEYVELVDPVTLQAVSLATSNARLLIAVKLFSSENGQGDFVRLIDNAALGESLSLY